MKHLASLLVTLALVMSCNQKPKKEAPQKDIDFKIELGTVSNKSVFKSDSLSIWGASMVKDDKGLYHIFYSQWPKHMGWEWVNYSEIAHATSKSPFGPFTYKDIALPFRGKEHWDGTTTHNPTALRIGDKYYIYYMGNTGNREIVSTPGKAKINWEHRNNQRIGVAIADSPNGPWKRLDKPVVDITHNDKNAYDALMTSNPSVCEMTDGKILVVYKAVGLKNDLPQGGPVVHMVAIGDTPTGPFKKFPNPVFVFEGERFPAEDPYIWHQDGKYRAIVKRIKFEGKKRIFSLVHYDSKDGIEWNKAKNFEVSDRTLTWEDGKVEKYDHLERPQVFIENGEPVALLCAADTLDVNRVRHSFNVQIPLKITKEVRK